MHTGSSQPSKSLDSHPNWLSLGYLVAEIHYLSSCDLWSFNWSHSGTHDKIWSKKTGSPSLIFFKSVSYTRICAATCSLLSVAPNLLLLLAASAVSATAAAAPNPVCATAAAVSFLFVCYWFLCCCCFLSVTTAAAVDCLLLSVFTAALPLLIFLAITWWGPRKASPLDHWSVPSVGSLVSCLQFLQVCY